MPQLKGSVDILGISPKIEFWLEAKEDLHTFFASIHYNFGRKFMKFAQDITHIDFCVLHKLHEF